jgi:predicted TIM-barrel fold metal-dependent hydrolase
MNSPKPQPLLSRRDFLTSSTALVLGAAAQPSRSGWAAEQPVPATPSVSPSGRNKVIDCHGHLAHRSHATWEEDDRNLIAAADRLGIDQLCCSILTPRRSATAEGFRECNRWVADGMQRFPGRILGYCYVNPGCGRAALDEVRRCVEQRGFIGVKLYNEYTCTDPVVFPVVELAIELGVPILHHAGHAHYVMEDQPRISDGGHFAELARRYPEAKLICAHICGGGDWEWTIKALRPAPSVFLDTSGSVTDEGVVEMAARVLGVDRLVFGCDMSMTASVGRMRGANLSAPDKARILGGNLEKLLRRRKS